MNSQDDKNLREKWIMADALAGDACPGDEKAGDSVESAKHPPNDIEEFETKAVDADDKKVSIPLLVTLGGALGLGLGVAFAMLLVTGELDLSLKEIKTIVQTIKALVPG